jgi:hypothetical protein
MNDSEQREKFIDAINQERTNLRQDLEAFAAGQRALRGTIAVRESQTQDPNKTLTASREAA